MTNSGTPVLVGDSVVASRLVTQEQINAYAVASGDHNPLHIDPAFAATTPLGGTVAHGMLVLGWLSALLTTAFGQEWLAGGSFRIRFRAPARPGDLLALHATVRDVPDDETGHRVILDLLVANQRGEAVIDGTGNLSLTLSPARGGGQEERFFAVSTSSPPSTENASSS